MDVLKAVAVEFPCSVCAGDTYAVTLRQILISQDLLLHEGCHRPDLETECPPAVFARLLADELILAFEQVWQRLEDETRRAGGTLSIQEIREQ